MSLTTTTPINAQSIGTSTNIGDMVFPQKVTLQAGTTALVIEGSVTNGAGAYHDRRQSVDIGYAVSSADLVAADAPVILQQSAKSLSVNFGTDGGAQRVKQTELIVAVGAYLYIWCSVPKLPVAGALTVRVLEP